MIKKLSRCAMEDVKTQVNDFLTKCEELKKCKFIMAPTKIKDLLKSIVNSRTLYDLFSCVSTDFDYVSAKAHCLVDVSDGYSRRGEVRLPSSSQEKLAFIFCLLVELDRDSINFNWFLQKYFSDDESYYASYFSFCKQIIEPLEKIISGVFEEELKQPSPQGEQKEERPQPQPAIGQGSELSAMLSALWLLIAQEKQFILESAMPDDDKETGYKMLDEIYNALKDRNFAVANAIVNGYNYYILYNNTISPNVQMLFESIENYEAAA